MSRYPKRSIEVARELFPKWREGLKPLTCCSCGELAAWVGKEIDVPDDVAFWCNKCAKNPMGIPL